MERARQWAIRCVHESQLHEANCFITLTYENTPPGASLVYRDFQLFMKRLRKRFKKKIRFYMCGEYGEQFLRPHYHACLFGIDFEDKTPWRKNHAGDQLYRSASLERLWKHGNSELGAVTFQSAAYVARYVMKKITGDLAQPHYTYLDEHGELHSRTPEFNQMSRRPGLAAPWLDRYLSDVYPHDCVVHQGKPGKPPRYYDNHYKKKNPLGYQYLKRDRIYAASQHAADNTPQRLQVKEKVAKAKAKLLKRTLD